MRTASIEITLDLPLIEGCVAREQYIKAALRKIAQSLIDNNENVEQAAIYGNWNYTFTTKQQPYQPTLWDE
jgi:hypothetical protein